MSATNINADLKKERENATFDAEKVTEFLYGGKNAVRRRRYLHNIVLQDKYLQSFKKWWNRERLEDYDACVKKSVYLNQMIKDLNLTNPVERFYLREAAACQETNVLGLHEVMFIPTIEKQGTKEQIQKYVVPARKFQIIGTYAQTELGHGTFIRGLETTATYDPKTEEFVIHSPTLTSMKYWPGAMGKTSNHVVLMAQLYSQGKRHGIHAFVVQIRSLENHQPLPGVKVGDIGNKLGYTGMDNGWLMFDHYRVPRDAMLMRYSKVEKDGTYIPPQNAKITYGSMVFIRALIVGDTARSLSQVCTIAVRYSAVRRQTEIRPGKYDSVIMGVNVQSAERSIGLKVDYNLVEKDGTYSSAAQRAIAYGTMVAIRAGIVGKTGQALSLVVTIATRYSAVRRQTEIRSGGPEPQVIDYQTQQQKLFPLLASSYALLVCGQVMLTTYNRISGNIEKGQLDEMQMLHALAAGLKALSSDITSSGIDKLRMACGGHGYTHASGIPKIFANITPACTYEGENTVMYLQCARYLVKCYAQAAAGQKVPAYMLYLKQAANHKSSLTSACELPALVEAFEHAAARLIEVAAKKIQALMKSGLPVEEARNKTSVQLVKAATAHSRAYVVKTFAEFVKRPDLSPDVARVMTTLCKLYAVCDINNNLGDFAQDGFLSGQQADMLMDKMLALFAEVRPDAVALVDAYDYPDHLLQSCLGRYDGNVYEALYEYAQGSPLNKQEVMDSYYSTLRPLMKGELKSFTPNARL